MQHYTYTLSNKSQVTAIVNEILNVIYKNSKNPQESDYQAVTNIEINNPTGDYTLLIDFSFEDISDADEHGDHYLYSVMRNNKFEQMFEKLKNSDKIKQSDLDWFANNYEFLDLINGADYNPTIEEIGEEYGIDENEFVLILNECHKSPTIENIQKLFNHENGKLILKTYFEELLKFFYFDFQNAEIMEEIKHRCPLHIIEVLNS